VSAPLIGRHYDYHFLIAKHVPLQTVAISGRHSSKQVYFVYLAAVSLYCLCFPLLRGHRPRLFLLPSIDFALAGSAGAGFSRYDARLCTWQAADGHICQLLLFCASANRKASCAASIASRMPCLGIRGSQRADNCRLSAAREPHSPLGKFDRLGAVAHPVIVAVASTHANWLICRHSSAATCHLRPGGHGGREIALRIICHAEL